MPLPQYNRGEWPLQSCIEWHCVFFNTFTREGQYRLTLLHNHNFNVLKVSSEAIDFLIQLEVTIDNIDSETKRPDGTYEHTCDKCKCV